MSNAAQHRVVSLLLPLVLVFMPWTSIHAEGVTWDFNANSKFSDVMFGETADPIVYTEDKSPAYVLTRFVIEGESAVDWIEAFEVLDTLRKNSPKTLEGWYEQFREQGEQNCPGGEWHVIAQSDNSLTFERRTSECEPFAGQHALYRVLYGKKEIFTLIATRKGAMDEATRSAWLDVLESAAIR